MASRKPTKKLPASKIERAKALKALEAIAPDAVMPTRSLLLQDGAVGEVEFDRSVAGLKEEDEFAVMCKLMGTCILFADIGQRPLIISEFIAPDFLAGFQAGCLLLGIPESTSHQTTCLIEVKSTDKDEFKIAGSLLRRRRQFADHLGLPLFLRSGFRE